MRTCVFDLETSSLYANSGIILCASIQEFTYQKPKKSQIETILVTPETFRFPEKNPDKVKNYVIRADRFKSWKHNKTDNSEVVKAIMDVLCGVEKTYQGEQIHDGFDIFIAHNGQYFDKAWLNAAALKYGLRPRLRFEKFVDPYQIAKRHLRLARNSLAALSDFFDIEESKTPIRFKYWMEASLNGDSKALDYIVDHCVADVEVLMSNYRIVRKLVKGVDERGGL